jgi:hypothetical protein
LSCSEQFLDDRLVSVEVAQFGGMPPGHSKRLDGPVKANEVQLSRQLPCGTEDGQGVGRGAEADIPDNKGGGGGSHTFHQVELSDVKKVRLLDWAQDRVKGFLEWNGPQAEDPIGEAHQAELILGTLAVVVGCRGR